MLKQIKKKNVIPFLYFESCIMNKNIFHLSSALEIGDHLIVPGQTPGIKYAHHGIYSSAHKVIHFGGDNKDDAIVEEIDLYQFLPSNSKELKRIIYKKCLPPEKVLERARKVLNKKIPWGEYHLAFNNCEHFATYCKTGVGFSLQSLKALMKVFEVSYQVARQSKSSGGGGIS